MWGWWWNVGFFLWMCGICRIFIISVCYDVVGVLLCGIRRFL